MLFVDSVCLTFDSNDRNRNDRSGGQVEVDLPANATFWSCGAKPLSVGRREIHAT